MAPHELPRCVLRLVRLTVFSLLAAGIVCPTFQVASAQVVQTLAPVEDVLFPAPMSGSGPQKTVLKIDVLKNDRHAEGTTLTVIHVSDPEHGTAVFNPTLQKIVYTADSPQFPPDRFTYTVQDSTGQSAQSFVTIREPGSTGTFTGPLVYEGACFGWVRLTVNRFGKATGLISQEGLATEIEASFGVEGSTEVVFLEYRPSDKLTLQIEKGRIRGSFNTFIAKLGREQLVNISLRRVENIDAGSRAGQYTLMFSHSKQGSNVKESFGWGIMTISPKGTVTLKGKLDHRPFMVTSNLRLDPEVALYGFVSSKFEFGSGPSWVGGFVRFEDLPDSDGHGTLNWREINHVVNPDRGDITVLISRYEPRKKKDLLLTSENIDRSASLTFFPREGSVTAVPVVMEPAPSYLRIAGPIVSENRFVGRIKLTGFNLAFERQDGRITGRLMLGKTRGSGVWNGVVFQKQNRATGIFRVAEEEVFRRFAYHPDLDYSYYYYSTELVERGRGSFSLDIPRKELEVPKPVMVEIEP